jgi:uncharacterized protein YqhQ
VSDASQIRLGGMALPNGVLVHGPRHWSCAVRTDDGELKVASGRKPVRAVDMKSRLVRGPARVAEIFALLPEVRRHLPDAKLPFQRPGVVGAMAGSILAIQAVRRTRLSPLTQESLAAVLALGPAVVALRGTALAEYHGAEHISIGSYEHGEPRTREHERCGTHMLGPLLATTAVGSALASRAPRHLRPVARAAAGVGSLAAAVEVFSWMVANERHPVARVLARPGHELQQRLVTAEPSTDQLEVANAALQACLALETSTSLESPANGHRDEETPPPA